MILQKSPCVRQGQEHNMAAEQQKKHCVMLTVALQLQPLLWCFPPIFPQESDTFMATCQERSFNQNIPFKGIS